MTDGLIGSCVRQFGIDHKGARDRLGTRVRTTLSSTIAPREQLSRTIAVLDDTRDRIECHWRLLLVLVAVAIQAIGIWRIVRRLRPGTRPGLRDSIIFEYYGARLADGARLYIDLWEVKPPLAFELPALLALLAGNDMVAYHWLSVLVTNAAVVGTVVVVGALVHERTGDGLAAIAGGLALFTNPAFSWRALIGFKAKYFVVVLGLLAIYLAVRHRPVLAGIAAGASVGFWQFGSIFPILVLGITYQYLGRRGVLRGIAGIAGIWVIILAPVAYWGALDAMLVETVLTPLVVSTQRPVAERIDRFIRVLGPTLPVVLIGCYGVVATVRREMRADAWWLALGTLWFGLVYTVFDFDWVPDLIPLLVFIALGIGVVVSESDQGVVVWLVAIMTVLSSASIGHAGSFDVFHSFPLPPVYDIPAAMETTVPYSRAERRFLFWQAHPPATCRVFIGVTPVELLQTIEGGRLDQAVCGRWEPVWEALLEKYGAGDLLNR